MKKLLFLLLCSFSLSAQPPGFVDELVSEDYVSPTGLTFDKSGQMYAWEKGGNVFKVDKNTGAKTLLLDISAEVYDYLDHGLNGLALHPNFLENGYFYLLYAVDRNYLYYKDSTFYSRANDDNFSASIGRVTRYTINRDSLNNSTVDLDSRKVLIGETHTTGIPVLMDNHGMGSLVFGADTSLMVTSGDAAIARDPPFQNGDAFYYELVTLPLEEGIITEDQNIGPYRAQNLNSLNGKMLRINPENGDGYPSNPFYQTDEPRSAESRIWAFGLRNPFRFSLKPETGSTDATLGDPGTFYVGDVGWENREEVNVIDSGGGNFGWPYFEGISYRNNLFSDPKYFPENAIAPILEWRGDFAQAFVDGEAYGVGSPEFLGEPFTGNSSIGGLWLSTGHFKGFKGTYIQGDYEGWIKIFKFDFRGNPFEVLSISENVHPVCFAEDPTDGSIYYMNFFFPDTHEIRRIYNEPNPNFPPVTEAFIDPIYGAAPLNVRFDASSSYDPEGQNLTYLWDFGNGFTSNNQITDFRYTDSDEKLHRPSLTITDEAGKSTVKQFKVHVNNYPPEIISTSVQDVEKFKNEDGLTLDLSAVVQNHNPLEELYYTWSVILHHEDHSHLIRSYKSKEATTSLAPIPCDEQEYSYEIKLFVHDNTGLGPTISKFIKPVCPGDEVILGLELSPNPVDLKINLRGIDSLDEMDLNYHVFNNHGQLLRTDAGKWKNLKRNLNKEVAKYSPGIYILRVNIDGRSQSFRFVKI
ncbi:PQQ-dependent sugar dehydrogenase [uncultured Arcticibacterium sp.]|uniref:PQQ-dependent sugar dehydrogenase n=1 Tax=uncultured Arcticibacterium sp. TaxID=2173042 RepID=UPI0030FC2FCF